MVPGMLTLLGGEPRGVVENLPSPVVCCYYLRESAGTIFF